MKLLPAALVIAFALTPLHAFANQQFAKETMLACSSCHTATMQLTALGKGFRNSNLRMVSLTKNGEPAVAFRGQFAYSSEPDPTGLPKAIVDEVDDYLTGQIADNWRYYAEVYNLDGGRPGATREAWVEYSSAHQRLSQAFRITAGVLPLPTPVDPESFRELNEHYEVWDQTVGANTFDFFDPHHAVELSRGSEIRGTSVSLAAVQGADGLDRMAAIKQIAGPVVLDVYRYEGSRPTGLVQDKFSRNGIGASVYSGRFQTSVFSQSGYDSSPNGNGEAVASGGGFLETRYQVTDTLFAIARYEGIEDGTGIFDRTFTVGSGIRLGKAFRLEAEDVIQHVPQTKHTLNAVFGFGLSNVQSQAY